MKDIYSPEDQFDYEDWEHQAVLGEVPYMPGIDPRSVDYDNGPVIIDGACDFYRNEINRHLLCKESPEVDDYKPFLEAQELLNKKKDPSYTMKPIQLTTCIHHKNQKNKSKKPLNGSQKEQ